MSTISPRPALSLDDEDFAFQHSTPLLLRSQSISTSPALPPNDDYLVDDVERKVAVTEIHDDEIEVDGSIVDSSFLENGDGGEDRRTSGGSSISSFPASIAQPPPLSYDNYVGPRTPTRQSFERAKVIEHITSSPKSAREYYSAFRHPSSVRALQMRDETMSDTHSVLRHHRRSGSQMSSYSHRSSYSTSTSPTKRSSRSHRGSPQKVSSNLRKEYPLVLLHCTILPPSLLPHTNHDAELISDLLPEEYRKRWATLRDKFVGDAEVRTRGVLISHPKEDYELLEERLLEALELEAPRIHHNHYLYGDGASGDSGFESGSATDEDVDPTDSCGKKCPDCGSKLQSDESSRKWEVKVYAANGLMRAGAWEAAWQEMEKVDVEIRLWLPEALRRDVEAKLALIEPMEQEIESVEESQPHETHLPAEVSDAREREIYGDAGRSRSQAEIDGFYEEPMPEKQTYADVSPVFPSTEYLPRSVVEGRNTAFQDRKNILVAVLSALVLFFAFAGKQTPSLQEITRPGNETIMSKEILTMTVTATATSLLVSTETILASVNPVMQPMEEEPSSTMPERLAVSRETIHPVQEPLTFVNDVPPSLDVTETSDLSSSATPMSETTSESISETTSQAILATP